MGRIELEKLEFEFRGGFIGILGVGKSNFERVVLRPWKQFEQVYFDKLDLVGLKFYLKLIQFENSPFQPQILIKFHDFKLDSIHWMMRICFESNLR